MKQRGRRGLSMLLTLCLLAGLSAGLAVPAAAADHWAQSAVDTLNQIYSTDVFSTDESALTVSEAQTILKTMGSTTNKLTGTGSDTVTRSLACEVLADVFALPIGDQSAIQYLYHENIINGKSPNDLAENDPVTKAEFAVLTYRVLNAVGGGEGTKSGWPTPGSQGYTAWMYLAVRKCVPFEMDQADKAIGQVTNLKTYVSSSYNNDEDRQTIDGGITKLYEVTTAEKSGEEIWNAWVSAMQDPNIGGMDGFAAPEYNGNETLLNAAIRMVNAVAQQKAYKDPVIFHDVNAGNWFYDGIMYLVNNNIVVGYGDGKFGPDDITPRYELAVLLTNVEGVTLAAQSGPGRILEAIQYVTKQGYITGEVPDPSEEESWNPKTDPYWGMPATREEAAVGILRMIEHKDQIDTSSDNVTVLDRFSDAEKIQYDASKPYLAYAVSMGLLSGTSTNTLEPDSEVSRAQVGVLLYRTLFGVDKTKMQDYRESVGYALSGAGVDTQGGN